MIFAEFILAAVAIFASSDGSELSESRAASLIEAAPEVVEQGYRRSDWISKNMIWFDVEYCDGLGLEVVGALRTCAVCSIDDVSGQVYDSRYMQVYKGETAPSYAVAITASTATFRRGLEGDWQFSTFNPLSVNYLASNGHPYHRADIDRLKRIAPRECREMRQMQEFIIRG